MSKYTKIYSLLLFVFVSILFWMIISTVRDLQIRVQNLENQVYQMNKTQMNLLDLYETQEVVYIPQ